MGWPIGLLLNEYAHHMGQEAVVEPVRFCQGVPPSGVFRVSTVSGGTDDGRGG